MRFVLIGLCWFLGISDMARIPSILAKKMIYKILAFVLLQGVLTSVGSDQSDVSPGSVAHSGGVFGSEAAETKSRPKRCTCYSYKDKECVYYCHLDIIWINTPERTVPYGMSSYQGPQRIRRAVVGQPTEHQWAKTQRCTCVLDADPKCHDFCLLRPPQTVPPRSLHKAAGPG
ncbi:endothelin-3b isoform X1 [Scophthalmus maximus]|uniref:Endothelin-3 n=1 Tax=Scophthalmus maximus TaxID=52904 RepID=A0A8D3CLK4_SCOMX|nr:endothelin-3b isoform X1 [Scophthalmus maximus]XP_047187287.1 endothelin-3b isoform X1 [Scophthalmus maximus]